VLNTALSRRSTRKPIFITTAMDCRVFVCFATDPTTTSPLGKSPTSVSGANLPTSAIASSRFGMTRALKINWRRIAMSLVLGIKLPELSVKRSRGSHVESTEEPTSHSQSQWSWSSQSYSNRVSELSSSSICLIDKLSSGTGSATLSLSRYCRSTLQRRRIHNSTQLTLRAALRSRESRETSPAEC
jgi:hypothetical protein